MRSFSAPLLLLAALGVSACAGGAGGQDRTRAAAAGRIVSDSEAPDPGPLADAGVPPGRCGMILWTLAGASAVPVFRSVDDGTADMQVDGQALTLSLVGRGGEDRLGIPAVQQFEGRLEGGEPVTVVVRGDWGRAFPAGAYVERAALSLTGADGWTRTLPTAGIAGCRP